MSKFYTPKTIDNEPEVSTTDVETAINGSTITPLSVTATDITGNTVEAKELLTGLTDAVGINDGSGVKIINTLSSPSIELNVDTNGDGSVNQSYSLLGSEGANILSLRDNTNTRDILFYEPTVPQLTINSPTINMDTFFELKTATPELNILNECTLNVNGNASFLNGEATNLNTNSKITINSDNNSPTLSVISDLGGSTSQFDITTSETDGTFRIQNTQRDLIKYDTASESLNFNGEIILNPTVSPKTSFYPSTDSGAQLGLVSRRFLDIYSFFTNVAGGESLKVQVDGRVTRDASDQRVKKNIADIPLDWTKFNALQPRSFNFKTDAELETEGSSFRTGSDGLEPYCGFIAQEIETVDTGCMYTSGYDGIKGIKIEGIVALAVKHIQDLEARIKVLEGV